MVAGRARGEDAGDPDLGQLAMSSRDDAAAEHHDVLGVGLPQQGDHPPELGHVRAGQHRQADGIGVLGERRRDDLLGRLVQPGVDDLHSRVPQRPGDDLDAAIVPVQARFGHHHPDRPGGNGRRRSPRPVNQLRPANQPWPVNQRPEILGNRHHLPFDVVPARAEPLGGVLVRRDGVAAPKGLG